MKLTFLGATGTVTGSRTLLEAAGRRILIDCGLFQGLKELRLRNWEALPVEPRSIDAVVLTHAHVDHSGYLPVLVKNGFAGPVYASAATGELCRLLLPDSAHLQEEQALHANMKGYSKHHPALPLYEQRDAERAINHFQALAFDSPTEIFPGISLQFRRAGHILGAAFASLRCEGRHILFSGDLGRLRDPLMVPPVRVPSADYLVVESTYGDRHHARIDPLDEIEDVVNRTIHRGGVVVVPAFAVGRAQSLLYYLQQLKAAGRIPPVPVFLNSPMAVSATRIFRDHPEDHRLSERDCEELGRAAKYVNTVEESKALNRAPEPKIIISASGMATGGRVLHHLKAFAPDPRNTILFTGFQAAGTRGAQMVQGAESVKIHGMQVPVRAEVMNLNNLSAHADADEILEWLGGFDTPPAATFINHGEPAASEALHARITETLGWQCHTPSYLETFPL